MDWLWRFILHLTVTLMISGEIQAENCKCECQRISNSSGCHNTSETAIFNPNTQSKPLFQEPECTTPISTNCDACDPWKCCRINVHNISCEVDLHKAKGRCTGYNGDCKPNLVCCYNVICNCKSPQQTITTTMPETTSLNTTTPEQTTLSLKTSAPEKSTSPLTAATSKQQSDNFTPSIDGNKIDMKLPSTSRPENDTGYTSSSSTTTGNAVLGASARRSGGMGAGIGIGVSLCIILVVLVVSLFYCHKHGILQKISNRVHQDEKSKESVPSESYAEIGPNTYAEVKTITNLNHGYNASDKDQPTTSGESEYTDVLSNNQLDGDMGAAVYVDPEQCTNKQLNGDMGAAVYVDPEQCTYGNKKQESNPQNSGYDDLKTLVITGPQNTQDEYIQIYADTVKHEGNQSTGSHVAVKQSPSSPAYEDAILKHNVPIQSAYQSLKRPASADMGEGEYIDPEEYTSNQTKIHTAGVLNPSYDDIGKITIPGSQEVEYAAVNKRKPSSDDMGSGEYMDPEKYTDGATGQKTTNDVENPGYDDINKIIIPGDKISATHSYMDLKKPCKDQPPIKPGEEHYQSLTDPEHYEALTKPEQEHYQSLNQSGQGHYQALNKSDKQQYQSLKRPGQDDYQALKPEQGLYQDLKQPEPEDIGSEDYADPEKYTDIPAFVNGNKENTKKQEDEEAKDLDDREYFTLEPPNDGDNKKDDEEANDEREYFTLEPPNDGDNMKDDEEANDEREYFTLEPPNDEDNKKTVDEEANDEREYFTLEPPNSGDQETDGAPAAADDLEEREYYTLEPPGDADENTKTGQDEREYSTPPDAK